MTEDWKHVKDFFVVGVGKGFTEDFLRDRGLFSLTEGTRALENLAQCITNISTEDGLKSCITLNIEDFHPRLRSQGKKKDAQELYDALVASAKKDLSQTWGQFIL